MVVFLSRVLLFISSGLFLSSTVDHPSLEFEPATDTLPADKLRLTALQMQAASGAFFTSVLLFACLARIHM